VEIIIATQKLKVEVWENKVYSQQDTSRNPFEHQLWNNNKRQDCKIDTAGGTCGRVRVNGGDESESIWLMGFIYIHEIKPCNLLQLL
jgi:hypothetical protein